MLSVRAVGKVINFIVAQWKHMVLFLIVEPEQRTYMFMKNELELS